LSNLDERNSNTGLNPNFYSLGTMALAFFTASDTFGELQSLRTLKDRNFVCMGNKTSSDDTRCFRTIIGGGTELVNPIWQFCNLGSFPPSAVVEFCVKDWTECSAKIIDQPVCTSGRRLTINGSTPNAPISPPIPLKRHKKGEITNGMCVYVCMYVCTVCICLSLVDSLY
jgi:hypothetical protein